MTQHERDLLAHLAHDWDAQAAQIERRDMMLGTTAGEEQSRILRSCAEQMREKLASLRG